MPRLIGSATMLVLLGGCQDGVLSPAGPVANAERTILLDSLAIMLVIVIPTILATLVFAWWFRSSNTRAQYRPDWSYSGKLELIVWSIPALVVLFLGGIAWIGSHDLDPTHPLTSSAKPLEIQVIALDWRWLFIYPEQNIASINRMPVPAGIPLHLRLTSATVMNAFFVPRLGSEIYAMNGMTTQLNLQADQPGTYHGLSAHFSGDGFSDMAFDVQAMPKRDFTTWVATTQSNGIPLDNAAYRRLLSQSKNATPIIYNNLQNGLFDDVVSLKLPPGNGPSLGQPSPAISPRQEK